VRWRRSYPPELQDDTERMIWDRRSLPKQERWRFIEYYRSQRDRVYFVGKPGVLIGPIFDPREANERAESLRGVLIAAPILADYREPDVA
jgi:hypothetical protein